MREEPGPEEGLQGLTHGKEAHSAGVLAFLYLKYGRNKTEGPGDVKDTMRDVRLSGQGMFLTMCLNSASKMSPSLYWRFLVLL